MQNVKHRLRGSVAALALAVGAFSPYALAGTADEVAAINGEIVLLQAKLKKLELEDNIARKRADTAATEREMGITKGDISSNEAPTPVVRSMEGFGGVMTALLAYSTGETVMAKKGANLPGGWSVVEIMPGTVVLKRMDKLTMLKFGHAPDSEAGTAQNGTARPVRNNSQSGFPPPPGVVQPR